MYDPRELERDEEEDRARAGIPERLALYIVVRDGCVVQTIHAAGGTEARGKQAEAGELYIRVGG